MDPGRLSDVRSTSDWRFLTQADREEGRGERKAETGTSEAEGGAGCGLRVGAATGRQADVEEERADGSAETSSLDERPRPSTCPLRPACVCPLRPVLSLPRVLTAPSCSPTFSLFNYHLRHPFSPFPFHFVSLSPPIVSLNHKTVEG